jgi:hypothetical protein
MKKIYFLFFFTFIFLSFKAICLPALNSFPSAKGTIFLDFDGQFIIGSPWNSGTPFYAAPSGFNDAQITEIFNRVAEDFRPFNINITTDSIKFLSAPLDQRIRIIVTPTSSWYSNVGGVSYTGSFTWGDDTPGFVFVDKLAYSPKNVAECCTHESGHTLGLSHQAKYNGSCALIATYNDGIGSGEIGWAPVMGNSYSKNVSGWNNGPTPSGCTNDQDNLSIITSRNGFTYREDDHSDDPKNGATFIDVTNQSFADGIISTNFDKDAFKIVLPQDGRIHVISKPFSVGPDNEGANLDIKFTLLNSSMEAIQVYDPENTLSVSVDTVLNSGTYYILIQGAANINRSNYGSLGSYTIATSYSPLVVLPKVQVTLSANQDYEKHDLRWNITSSEPISDLILENSSNGTIFNTQTAFAFNTKEFDFKPLLTGKIYYRIKVVSVKGEVFYSNVVSLFSEEKMMKPITVSTLVRSEINVTSSHNYKFQLADMSGRIIKTGAGANGNNNININNCPNGIYFLQIISNSQRTTQRIVKL